MIDYFLVFAEHERKYETWTKIAQNWDRNDRNGP